MRQEADDPGGTLIGDLIAAVRRRAIWLGLWILFCLIAGLGYVAVAQPEYVASAQIALEPRVRLPPGTDAAAAASAAAPVLDSAQTESQLQVIRSARNLRYVFDTLKLDSDSAYADKGPGLVGRTLGKILGLFSPPSSRPSDDELASRAREIAFQNFSDRVQVRRLGQSYVLEVSFRGLTPANTTRITNSIAAAYIRDQVFVHAASDQRGIEFLQGRISLIQAEKKAAEEAVATGVITDFQFPDSDARIVGSALPPLAAAFPQTKLILLFSGILGLVTGIASIAVLHNFDRKVRSPAQIRRLLGVDCLVSVPRWKAGRLTDTTALTQPETEFALAMRLLRTVIFAAGIKSQQVSIGFVGCQEGDGCTILSANLAHLLAAFGSRVALIDANLGRPDLTRRLAPRAGTGLDTIMQSPSPATDLPEVAITPSLSFVPAVAGLATGHKADPNAFLGSPAIRTGLSHLVRQRDVILDMASLESSPDAQAIGHMLTGVVLVATLNRTKLDQLSEAIRALRSANTRVLGIVLNDPARSRKDSRLVNATASRGMPTSPEPAN
ncbi:Wzz/FepE/Etk N-terminal domain-containing protein [Methylobacterium sp. NFXW15]|uniref:CpsD/CapB family tyrosine-protein kinase n=1 Tax=Methylobacterium sp. NFXW15 TaxID=2819512 RepID=UPI003CEEC680